MAARKKHEGISLVAANAIREFEENMCGQAVKLVTPFPDLTPLDSCLGSERVKEFVSKYEPNAKKGLFPHQAEFLKSFALGGENFLVTTATGSGKSLCFWAWVVGRLTQEAHSTSLACFPTQALMWGQAQRLARISDPKSLVHYGDSKTPYSGRIRIAKESIGWTVWFGTGQGATLNKDMATHEVCDGFATARIRLATLDKAHWSLFRAKNFDFASRLRSLVLDEAHTYNGVFGANVHFFLRRMYLAAELCGQTKRPAVFLASATLVGAKRFAAQLLGAPEAEIVHIEDTAKPQVELIPLSAVVENLANPPKNGLMRIALLLDDAAGKMTLATFLEGSSKIGPAANAIYFSESKFYSKKLKLGLSKTATGRDHVIYDADLPPEKRREIEQRFNDHTVRGVTLLATNALELGVDIEGLDVCILDRIPTSRTAVVQRVGRVGRRGNRPGLILLRLSSEPHDRQILEDPIAAFQLDDARPLQIPIHLDLLRYKHALAAFKEWMEVMRLSSATWPNFNKSFGERFGFDPTPQFKELKSEFDERFGKLVDTQGDAAWVYKGFRASASQGKIPLIDQNGNEVARIEADAVFRDAHPEAVFLGHDLGRYRVMSYKHKWQVAEWKNPASDTVLGKWLPSLQAVNVRSERKQITTRGKWCDSFEFYERQELISSEGRPRNGQFEFGVWDYCRQWDGYTEIDLATGRETKVPLTEVSNRFQASLGQGSAIPFLHNFSYRTVGWEWTFGRLDHPIEAGEIVSGLLEHFLADVVESSLTDLRLRLDYQTGRMQVLDATPGGNGLSRVLLTDCRMSDALSRCEAQVSKFNSRSGVKRFKSYVLNLCHMETDAKASEVSNAVRELREHWAK